MSTAEFPIVADLKTNLLHSWRFEALGDIAVVCVSGIGRDDSQPPSYEFARCATNGGVRSTLFLSDPQRSWLSAPNLIETMVEAVQEFVARVKAKKVVTLGHSLGGFTAMVLPAFTKIDRVIALSPQMSVDPAVVPEETRWKRHIDAMPSQKIKLASDHFVPDTHYTIVHGRFPREAIQRDLVPRAANVRHYVMPHTNHNVPQRLKQAGALIPFVNAVCDGRDQRAKKILKTHFQAKLETKKTTQKPTPSPVLEGTYDDQI